MTATSKNGRRWIAESRRLQAQINAQNSVPFSYSGALTASTSPPWVPQYDGSIVEVRGLLGTAGSTSTVITVYVNGTSIGTLTLASSVTNDSAVLAADLVADTDSVTVGVTTAGTGAKDLTVLVRVVDT